MQYIDNEVDGKINTVKIAINRPTSQEHPEKRDNICMDFSKYMVVKFWVKYRTIQIFQYDK